MAMSDPEQPSAESPGKHEPRSSAQPLYIRMYFQPHLTDLVRLIGDGRIEGEAREEFRKLVEKYGEDRMKAAAAEIAERVPGQEPPVVRLTAHARQLAIGILGRPKAAAAVESSPQIASADEEPPATEKDPNEAPPAPKSAAPKKAARKKAAEAKPGRRKRSERKPQQKPKDAEEKQAP